MALSVGQAQFPKGLHFPPLCHKNDDGSLPSYETGFHICFVKIYLFIWGERERERENESMHSWGRGAGGEGEGEKLNPHPAGNPEFDLMTLRS